jgi:hypothetical protein
VKYFSFFLIATVSLMLIAFAPFGGSTPLAPIEVQNVARQNPTMRVDPVESVVDVGETFTITVMIDEASDLGAFQFDLLYITTTVTVGGVILGDFLGSTGRPANPIGPIIDNQAGKAKFGAWTLDSAPGPDGTGELAIVSFTTQGMGISPLDLQNVMVLDTTGGHQTVTVEDGTVVAGGTPTSTPTATTTPTSTATPTATPTLSGPKIYLPLVLKGW